MKQFQETIRNDCIFKLFLILTIPLSGMFYSQRPVSMQCCTVSMEKYPCEVPTIFLKQCCFFKYSIIGSTNHQTISKGTAIHKILKEFVNHWYIPIDIQLYTLNVYNSEIKYLFKKKQKTFLKHQEHYTQK